MSGRGCGSGKEDEIFYGMGHGRFTESGRRKGEGGIELREVGVRMVIEQIECREEMGGEREREIYGVSEREGAVIRRDLLEGRFPLFEKCQIRKNRNTGKRK